MIDVLRSGVFESDDEVESLMHEHRRLVIPSDDEDLELTHWWVLNEDGEEVLYLGTLETFSTYLTESNGGIH